MPQPTHSPPKTDKPLATLKALVARGRELFLETIAGQDREAERLEGEARSWRADADTYPACDPERAELLGMAAECERGARAARAHAAANRATMARVDAVLVGEDA